MCKEWNQSSSIFVFNSIATPSRSNKTERRPSIDTGLCPKKGLFGYLRRAFWKFSYDVFTWFFEKKSRKPLVRFLRCDVLFRISWSSKKPHPKHPSFGTCFFTCEKSQLRGPAFPILHHRGQARVPGGAPIWQRGKPYVTNPNNALFRREIPQHHYTFAACLILPKWVIQWPLFEKTLFGACHC